MLKCVVSTLEVNALHLLEYKVKRKRSEELKDLGFTLKDVQHTDYTVFIYE